jgi:hypothetical protein
MKVIDSKTDNELLRSLVAETAKTSAELRCAKQDIETAQTRAAFAILLLNELIDRSKK